MSDAQRERELEALGRALGRTYSPIEDTVFEAEVRGVHRRRKTMRRVSAVVALVIIAGAVGLLTTQRQPVPGVASVRIASDASYTAAAGAHVRTRANEAGLLWLELEQASARFEVAPQGGRLVRVSAGDVQVEVIGTTFVVTRSEHEVSVRVTEGKVRVRHGAREALLAAGEVGAWPLLVAQVVPEPQPSEAPVAEPVQPEPVEVAPRAPAPSPKPAKRPTTWRALAEQGDYGGAWTAMQGEGMPDDEPKDLLRAADVARLSGHPAQAVAPLRRILVRFTSDPRASLAAFTLGRVLLDDLGNPREAAAAFTQAWELAPKSPLAPDAAARAVEAHARAGEEEAARETAERFLRDFPRSGRVDAVKRWGKVP